MPDVCAHKNTGAAAVPSTVVRGDAELLASRALLMMNLLTAGMMPLLKTQSLTDSSHPVWYTRYTTCMCCVLQLLKDVRTHLTLLSLPTPPV